MTSSMPQKNAYDARDDFVAPTYMSKEPKTFPIRVHINNETHEPGKKMFVRASKIKTFENFLDECTESMKAPFGAVRRIYTARGRRRICSLDELQEDSIYVVTGTESFKKHNYRDITERRREHTKGNRKANTKYYPPVLHANNEQHRKKSGKSFYLSEHSKGIILRVHINGYTERPVWPISVSPKEKDSLYGIKVAIERSLNLGTIGKLYCIINCGGRVDNFVEVHDASEVEHNGHYLVIPGNQKLQPKFYSLSGMHNFHVATSPRSGQYYLYPSFESDPKFDPKKYKHNQSLNKHKPLPSIGSSSKQSDAVSPFSNPPSQHGRGGRRSKGRGHNVDYDRDEGGVYRARGNNARGAQQVNDTYETRTERPIDQMEAEEVEEERIQMEKGTPIPPGTELNKQPSVEQKQHEKGTNANREVKSKVKSKESSKTDPTTYRVNELPPKVDDDDKDKHVDKGDSQANEEDRVGSRADSDTNVKADKEERMDSAHNNDKGQTTDDLEQESSSGIQNQAPLSTVSPDKRSIGSQANTPPNKTRTEERTASEEQGIHRIDEFDDESFGGDSHYGGNSSLNKSVTNNPRASTPQSRGETRRKQELQRENEAATRIQAGVRGYKVRKDNRLRAEAEQKEKAERENDLERRRSVDDETRKRQDAAATKIQAGYKGYKTRKVMNAKKAQVSDTVDLDKPRKDYDAAASKIQAGYKGYKTRKDFNTRKTYTKQGELEHDSDKQNASDSKRYENAAVKIQAGYRGYKTRKLYASRKEAKKVVNDLMTDEKQDQISYTSQHHKAAEKIQAGYKGYKVRKDYKSKKQDKQKEKAATKIQAGFRGYQTRKKIGTGKKSEDADNEAKLKEESAATKIQAGFRGYKTRKEIKSKVIDRLIEGEGLNTEKVQFSIPSLEASVISKQDYTAGSRNDLIFNIQAAVRGYNARKRFILCNFGIKNATASKNDFISSLQAAFKGYNARKKLTLYNLGRTHAVTKIQAAYMSYKMRLIKFFSSQTVNFEEFKKYKAGVKIHAILSGYIERKHAFEKALQIGQSERELISNSSWIQNRETNLHLRRTPQGPFDFDTEKCYWEDSNVKMYPDHIKQEAATKVQATFFSFYTRKKYFLWKARQAVKSAAARKILASVKGYIVRQAMKKVCSPVKDDEFVSVMEPKSAVEIYGRDNDELDIKLINNYEKTLHTNISDKDSCFTEYKSLNDSYAREKSLGYGTISASGEVEKEGDSVKEIEDEAGEIDAITKHVYAISCLQAAFRAYKMRKEFQELLSGGGELIDIAKVDRAVSALRKEFRFRSAKVRRLAACQFGSSDQRAGGNNWWEAEVIEASDETVPDPLARCSQIDSCSDYQTVTTIASSSRDDTLENDSMLVLEEPSESSTDKKFQSLEKTVSSYSIALIKAGFKSYAFRKHYVRNKLKKKAVRKIQDTFRSYIVRKYELVISDHDRSNFWQGSENLIDLAKEKGTNSTSCEVRKAGSVVQAAARNFLVRKNFYVKQKNRNACIKIQAAFKGFIVRKETFEREQFSRGQDFNATIIQTACKGYLHRIKSKRILPGEINAKAVCKIQAAVSGFLTRYDVEVSNGPDQRSAEKDGSVDIDGKASISQAACHGYLQTDKHHSTLHDTSCRDIKAIDKIQAAFNGFLTRNKEVRLQFDSNNIGKQSSDEREWTVITSDGEENDNIDTANILKVQAAFSAYQTRKVFISLTKLVEDNSVSEVGSLKLERMGSLSETDDFKLRHKSIAKIQTALEEHRQRNPSGIAVTVDGKFSGASDFTIPGLSSGRHTGAYKKRQPLSPIKSLPRGSPTNILKYEISSEAGSQRKKEKERKKKLGKTNVSKIEKYIKLNMAASIIQASFRGCRKRNRFWKRKTDEIAKRISKSSPKSENNSRRLNDRILSESEHETDKDLIRSRTASVKLEAERRKEIKKRVAAKESTQAVKTKAEKLRAEKEKEQKVRQNAVIKDQSLNSLENGSSASNLPGGMEEAQPTKRNFDEEYEIWKQERINAAIMIQSGWRGYRARKDMIRHEDSIFGKSEGDNESPKLIVINLGRSKSEIARAEERYNNASRIQMVYRTCKIRRKIKIKMAVSRYERNQAVSRIQSYYRGYSVRKSLGKRKLATRLQAAYKAYKVRENNQAEKLLRQLNAVSLIQATWKAFKRRRENDIEKEERKKKAEMNSSLIIIQTGFRGFGIRKKLLRKKKQIQNLAASRIQSVLKSALYRKDVKEKRNAKSYIIAAYRSYRKRRELDLFKEKQKALQTAASAIQSAYKTHSKRSEVLKFLHKTAQENEAAAIIHSAVRGAKSRKKEVLRKRELVRRELSALKIQSVYRGFLGRKMALVVKKETICKKQQNLAAIKIQSVFRGHAGRKTARHERYMKELYLSSSEIIELLLARTFQYLEKRSEAAIRVQSSVRGYRARMKHLMRKEQARIEAAERKLKLDKAATVIQSAEQANQRRLIIAKANKDKEENRAAVKIQSLYRGYNTRLGLKRERASLAKLSPPVLSPDPDELLQNARAIIAFHKNATLLQASFKAYTTRISARKRLKRKGCIYKTSPKQENRVKSLSDEEKAAVTIQKTFRGFSDRVVYHRNISERRRKEFAAADVVSVSIRGYITRKKKKILNDKITREGSPEVRKQRYNAACVIASVVRGYQKRKRKAALRVEM